MKKTFLLTALLFCVVAQSQKTTKDYGSITTDRPDQTESPSLVPKGLVQIETGFSYEENNGMDFKEKFTTYNSTLIRYGLLENLELRLGFDISESKTIRGNIMEENISSGSGPLYTGFKIGVAKEKGLLPEIGFLGGILLPFSAAKVFKPQGTGAEFRFAFSHTLSNKFSFSYNLGSAWNGNDPYVSYIYSTVLGYSFTNKLSGFMEVYGELSEQNESGHLVDGGFAYLLSNTVQIDVSGGTGLSTNQDFFIGAGFSIRLPE